MKKHLSIFIELTASGSPDILKNQAEKENFINGLKEILAKAIKEKYKITVESVHVDVVKSLVSFS